MMMDPEAPGRHDPFANAKPPSTNFAHLYRGERHHVIPTAKDLGERLRTLRTDLGISREEVARRSGVTEHEVTAFEESGEIGLQSMLNIVEAVSTSSAFHDAFALPRFTSIEEVVEHARRTRP